MIFNILRTGPNIHLKNKLLNIYAGITNENKLVLSTIETKTDFELMDLVNSYSLRIPNENNLVSINRLVLGIEASLNLRNPNQNQRFQIVNINKDTALNINQYTRCYTNEQSLDALESLKTLTIDLGSSVNDLDKKELLCNNNEHMVELIKTDNTLGIKCRENSKLNEQGKIINSKRSEFFKMTVNNFYHSHDFIVQDPIHNKFNVQSDLTYNSPKMDNQLELYSMKYGTYLNQTSAYKPLEKLFIFILMLKSQNIKNVKIDVESLYDYFSKQVVVDQYYELLVNNSI
jgi:hypothetical protein